MNADSKATTSRDRGCARLIIALAAVSSALAGCASGPAETETETRTGSSVTWDFEQYKEGSVPKGWRITETNPTASKARWEVTTDISAPAGDNVLALTESENYDGTFNLAIAKKTSFRDLALIVRAKAVSGGEDQGGGPVWRYQDAKNYYTCRFNPLEDNFRVYVVTNGRRRQLGSAQVDVSARRWYEIRVLMEDDEITCWLDGEELLYAADGTIAQAGAIGLWTKADAVTSFDALAVRPLDED
jgi:hypothetical protein